MDLFVLFFFGEGHRAYDFYVPFFCGGAAWTVVEDGCV